MALRIIGRIRLELIEEDNKETTSSQMHPKRTNFLFYPTIPAMKLCCIGLLTFLVLSIYLWASVHFWKKCDTFYIAFWVQNLFMFLILSVFLKSVPLTSGLRKTLQNLWPLGCLHLVTVIDYCNDFVTFTKKSSGTEYYQLTNLLYVPVLLAILQSGTSSSRIPLKVVYAICIFSFWKLSILYSDFEFELNFSRSCFACAMALFHGFYLIQVKEKLYSFSIVQIMLVFSWSVVMAFPMFVLLQHNYSSVALSSSLALPKFMISAFMAILKLISLSTTLILLKNTHPLICMLTMRCASIPDNFIQALVYKLDCVLSGSKVCVLTAFEFVFVKIVYLLNNRAPSIGEDAS